MHVVAIGGVCWVPLSVKDSFDLLQLVTTLSETSWAQAFKINAMINADTVEGINRMNKWVPESGMQMAWIGAVRVGTNGSALITRAKEIVIGPISVLSY